jgi:L-alanine-DL-glutamate epimerase-like enolase superfamily enzyme
MKITDIKLHVLKHETPGYVTSFSGLFKGERPPSFKYSLVRLLTNEGIEGDYIVWSEIPSARPDSLAEALRAYKPHLIGRDPLDREKIWQELGGLWYGQRGPAFAAIDIALWDIEGKVANLPVYRLMGAFRDRVRAYASGNVPHRTEDIVRIAVELKKRGYTAMKLHPIPVEACKALRDAVGDEIDLMYDAVFSFSREKALKVGKYLERLEFYWYEAPLPANDIEGYIELSRKLDIPVTVELLHTTDYLEFIRKGAVDYLRTMCGFTGGITEMRKVASLCEFYGINWEPHSYGGTFYQAAHLHAILAVKNCAFFELPTENGKEGCFDIGAKDIIRIDDQGYVHAPKKPGLGIDIDWKQVEEGTEIPI